MSDNTPFGEQARQFIKEKPYRIEQWENGTPEQQMLARGVRRIAEVG